MYREVRQNFLGRRYSTAFCDSSISWSGKMEENQTITQDLRGEFPCKSDEAQRPRQTVVPASSSARYPLLLVTA
eukprot:84971-Amorphochlora_amoeboformis.AAC.1